MPEHSRWLTLVLSHMRETLDHNAHVLGDTVVGHHPPTWQSFEAIGAALLVATILLLVSIRVRSRLSKTEEALIPEDRLTLRTFMEAFLGYFYDLAKSVMGPSAPRSTSRSSAPRRCSCSFRTCWRWSPACRSPPAT